jgi:hypothetical protein
MTDFSNPNNPSPFSNNNKFNGELGGAAKGKFSANKNNTDSQTGNKPNISPQTPQPQTNNRQMPADAMLKNMEKHSLAWITTGQNPELNPMVARIVQEVTQNMPSQAAVMTVYKKALTKVSEEFGWGEEEEPTKALAEEVTADLIIGRPIVKVTKDG